MHASSRVLSCGSSHRTSAQLKSTYVPEVSSCLSILDGDSGSLMSMGLPIAGVGSSGTPPLAGVYLLDAKVGRVVGSIADDVADGHVLVFGEQPVSAGGEPSPLAEHPPVGE